MLIGGFFILIAMACTFILCFKWLSQRGQKVYAIPQDEELNTHPQQEVHVAHTQQAYVAHPEAYVVHPQKEASAPPYDIKSDL